MHNNIMARTTMKSPVEKPAAQAERPTALEWLRRKFGQGENPLSPRHLPLTDGLLALATREVSTGPEYGTGRKPLTFVFPIIQVIVEHDSGPSSMRAINAPPSWLVKIRNPAPSNEGIRPS